MREFKVTYTDTDELDEAIERCEKATELEPENPVAWYNMGILKYDLVEYEEAIRCYDKAIDINPKYCGAILNKAELLRILKKDDEAKKYYQLGEKLRDSETLYDTTDTRLFRRRNITESFNSR